MISAEQARENYNVAKGYSANAKVQLEKLNRLITNMSIKGNDTLMYLNDPLCDLTRKELIELGYKLKETHCEDGYLCIITWDK
jgi:hypothetical protein